MKEGPEERFISTNKALDSVKIHVNVYRLLELHKENKLIVLL